MEKKSAIHYAHPYLSNPLHPITITLIGVGGTGSLVLGRLARMDYALQQLGHPGLHVLAIDGDIVEETNPGRQNFTKADLGDYKSENLIQKINFAFGLDWDASVGYVSVNPSHYQKFPYANIVITCVDNAQFRMDMNTMVKMNDKHKNKKGAVGVGDMLYWLDCGNGRDFGQAILSTTARIQQPESSKYLVQEMLPSVVDIYGDLVSDDTEDVQGIESCSMAESLAKQDLFINDKIAVEACDLLNNLLRDLYLNFHGSVVNMTSGRTVPMAIPVMAEEIEQPKEPHHQVCDYMNPDNEDDNDV